MVRWKGLAVCCGFRLAYCLAFAVAQALAAKNSVPHCFFNAATLTGSSPALITNKKTNTQMGIGFYGALEGTRTPDPLIRSQVLYPAELPAHIAIL